MNVFIFQIVLFLWCGCVLMIELYSCLCNKCEMSNVVQFPLRDLAKDTFHRNFTGKSSYGIIPAYKRTLIKHFRKISPKQIRRKIHRTSKCADLISTTSLRKNILGSNSTCPWYTVLDYDANRIPQTIAKAKCLRRRCLRVYDSQKSEQCEPIYSVLPVIRKICVPDTGKYQFEIFMEAIPVSCACKTHSINRIGPKTVMQE